jgi:hypothetical protein
VNFIMSTNWFSLRKRLLPFLVLGGLGFGAVGLLFGDGCGPVERGIRAALGAWDMWQSPAETPYERPVRQMPKHSVPMAQAPGYRDARDQVDRLHPRDRESQSKLAYRRFCHHCHGSHGDSRTIVAESFDFNLPVLRDAEIQKQTDEELFQALGEGVSRMIPLASSLSAVELLLAIEHMRKLKDCESKAVYPPQWTRPLSSARAQP